MREFACLWVPDLGMRTVPGLDCRLYLWLILGFEKEYLIGMTDVIYCSFHCLANSSWADLVHSPPRATTSDHALSILISPQREWRKNRTLKDITIIRDLERWDPLPAQNIEVHFQTKSGNWKPAIVLGDSREQGWCSGENASLSALWPGFDFSSWRHTWLEFVVCSLLPVVSLYAVAQLY